MVYVGMQTELHAFHDIKQSCRNELQRYKTDNMAMTPEDKAELARLDAEQVEDDAEVIQIAVERTQHAQQSVGRQERNVEWLES
jgi:hypothetical protein